MAAPTAVETVGSSCRRSMSRSSPVLPGRPSLRRLTAGAAGNLECLRELQYHPAERQFPFSVRSGPILVQPPRHSGRSAQCWRRTTRDDQCRCLSGIDHYDPDRPGDRRDRCPGHADGQRRAQRLRLGGVPGQRHRHRLPGGGVGRGHAYHTFTSAGSHSVTAVFTGTGSFTVLRRRALLEGRRVRPDPGRCRDDTGIDGSAERGDRHGRRPDRHRDPGECRGHRAVQGQRQQHRFPGDGGVRRGERRRTRSPWPAHTRSRPTSRAHPASRVRPREPRT